MTAQNPAATCACVNYGEAFTPEEIKDRSICIDGDIGDVLHKTEKESLSQASEQMSLVDA